MPHAKPTYAQRGVSSGVACRREQSTAITTGGVRKFRNWLALLCARPVARTHTYIRPIARAHLRNKDARARAYARVLYITYGAREMRTMDWASRYGAQCRFFIRRGGGNFDKGDPLFSFRWPLCVFTRGACIRIIINVRVCVVVGKCIMEGISVYI